MLSPDQKTVLARLTALKAYLYTIMTAILIILMSVVYWLLTKPAPEPNPFFCGTEALNPVVHKQGRELFNANCASCHNKNMKDNLTGPALGPALKDWSRYPEKDLYQFIQNSQKMIQKRQPQALKTWKEYQPVLMPSFEALTDADMRELVAYISERSF
jgi:cytochrome c553